MKSTFDIFWFGEHGPNWIRSAETLEAARAHIEALPYADSGNYAVIDNRTGNRLSFAKKLEASSIRTTHSEFGRGSRLSR